MKHLPFITALTALLSGAAPAGLTSSTFTYQGRLGDAGQPANGVYDLQFSLRDAATAGTGGAPVVVEDVTVQNGLFTATLDFGEDAFSEGARWLEIGVRPGAAITEFTLLSPRQPVTAAPLAVHAVHATSADTAQTALTAYSAATASTATTATNATNAEKAASAGSVAWNHVSGLPAGFSDGVDNDTTYTAGSGLTLGAGNQFALAFAGSGTQNTAARSDHSHFGSVWSGASPGTGLTLNNNATDGLGGSFKQGPGSGFFPIGGITGALWADAHDGPALFATSLDPAGAVVARNLSNATDSAGITGISGGTYGRGVYGHATSVNGEGAFGVVGKSESPNGAGIKAVAANSSSPALEIQTGGIKVSGSDTPAFVHLASGGNIVYDNVTVIDHPLCNGKSDAILIVTPQDANYWVGIPCVLYDSGTSRWQIWMAGDQIGDWDSYHGIIPGARFNVLVINR